MLRARPVPAQITEKGKLERRVSGWEGPRRPGGDQAGRTWAKRTWVGGMGVSNYTRKQRGNQGDSDGGELDGKTSGWEGPGQLGAWVEPGQDPRAGELGWEGLGREKFGRGAWVTLGWGGGTQEAGAKEGHFFSGCTCQKSPSQSSYLQAQSRKPCRMGNFGGQRMNANKCFRSPTQLACLWKQTGPKTLPIAETKTTLLALAPHALVTSFLPILRSSRSSLVFPGLAPAPGVR